MGRKLIVARRGVVIPTRRGVSPAVAAKAARIRALLADRQAHVAAKSAQNIAVGVAKSAPKGRLPFIPPVRPGAVPPVAPEATRVTVTRLDAPTEETVAVIIAAYGHEPTWNAIAGRAVLSAQNQTRKPNEIIRVHSSNIQTARNKGAEAATSAWLIFLDADDELDSAYIQQMLAGPGDVRYPSLVKVVHNKKGAPFIAGKRPLLSGNYIVIGAMIRREQFLRLGGFDDYAALEDWALWLKAEFDGADIQPVSKALYIAHCRPGSRNQQVENMQEAAQKIQQRFSTAERSLAETAAFMDAVCSRRGKQLDISYIGNFEPRHSTENHVAQTLETLGHRVHRLQENKVDAATIWQRVRETGTRLLLYTRTWGFAGDGNKLFRDLHAVGVPTASYHLDLYWGIARQNSIVGDPFWNTKFVFTADGGSEDQFRLAGINHIHMRAGVFQPECYKAAPDSRFTADVGFVGALDDYHPEWLPYRQKIKQNLTAWYGPQFRYWPKPGQPAVRNEDLNALYASVKIIVGDTLCPGFNHPRYTSDRVYETLGRGGFIIHPFIEGMQEEFEDGKTIVFYRYNQWDELKAKIDYYLAHEDERLRIRDAAHEFVKANCTYTNRLQEMLRHVALREGWSELL